jgi:hypothetical protein
MVLQTLNAEFLSQDEHLREKYFMAVSDSEKNYVGIGNDWRYLFSLQQDL